MKIKGSEEFQSVQELYFTGEYDKAFSLALKCAKQGEVKCVRFLGWLYYEGKGCTKDFSESLKWFREASSENDPEAFFGQGSIYYIQENYSGALQMFNTSSELGFAAAFRWLGILHEYGLGVNKNILKADSMYIESSRGGNIRAERAHIKILFQGHKGFIGRVLAVPLLLKIIVITFLVAFKNKDSQRFL